MQSENISELMAALAKAQGKIQAASKDKVNPYFKSKYADLASIREACREPLSENGLAYVQPIQNTPEGPVLVTILGHSSGQWIRGEMPIIVAKNDPQSLGSAITYYRRYSLAAMIGIAPDDDDDGEKAQNAYRSAAYQKPVQETQKQKISRDQLEELLKLLSRCDIKYQNMLKDGVKKEFNVDTFADIPSEQYSRIKTAVLANSKQVKEPELALAEVQ